ncbi:MAG: hypothetical protein K0S28_334 [Paucimonas sp.]|jgi:hypothetical protein|nr:hypothetical protein [Paucimonas sp.]
MRKAEVRYFWGINALLAASVLTAFNGLPDDDSGMKKRRVPTKHASLSRADHEKIQAASCRSSIHTRIIEINCAMSTGLVM